MHSLFYKGLRIQRKRLEIVYYVIQNAGFQNGYTKQEMKTFDVSKILLKTLTRPEFSLRKIICSLETVVLY